MVISAGFPLGKRIFSSENEIFVIAISNIQNTYYTTIALHQNLKNKQTKESSRKWNLVCILLKLSFSENFTYIKIPAHFIWFCKVRFDKYCQPSKKISQKGEGV